MPTYEYECTACGDRFELRQGFNDEPVSTCPSCQGRCRRVLFPAPIIFKGSGFYVTDSRQPKGETKTESKKDEGTPAASV